MNGTRYRIEFSRWDGPVDDGYCEVDYLRSEPPADGFACITDAVEWLQINHKGPDEHGVTALFMVD